MVDARGNGFSSEGKIVGLDAGRDLAVLKVLDYLVKACHSL